MTSSLPCHSSVSTYTRQILHSHLLTHLRKCCSKAHESGMFYASVVQCMVRWCEQTNALGRVFVLASRLCHRGQTHRFRCCSVAAVGAFECPKTNYRDGNKENFTFFTLWPPDYDNTFHTPEMPVLTTWPSGTCFLYYQTWWWISCSLWHNSYVKQTTGTTFLSPPPLTNQTTRM